tara:strand:- start:325 stop:456 length:132 start_codon:yes stop_codon:yes gene_type:complete
MSEVIEFNKPEENLSELDKQFLELERQQKKIQLQARLIRDRNG